MVSPHKLSSSSYFFVYDAGDNNVVGLIQPTPDNAYTLDAYMKYEDVVYTLGYDMLEAMERKNGKICDDSDSRSAEEHEMEDDT